MNWLELGKDTRKTLRFIMLSASKSIPLFNNFIVELSPESFLRVYELFQNLIIHIYTDVKITYYFTFISDAENLIFRF